MRAEDLFNDPKSYKRWYELHSKLYENERNVVRSFNLKDCLDVGSGPDIFHEEIGGRIVALDISLLMLKESKSDEKVLADALHLPFRDNSFKCVFSSVTVCFIEDVKGFIREMARITKERAIICFIARDSPWGEYYENLGKSGHKYYSHARFISRREFYVIINDFMKISRIRSTLKKMSETEIDGVYNDDSGSFICVEAIPMKPEPLSLSLNRHSGADPADPIS
ncbi:class I SAM-dependent methyltransferase [Saccharolobus solfataricus]|uniref:Methyltransferase, putative n=3 Tax=Saccharolobus solfataricus TaxID=2287 RepID=Q97WH3_SACS2|nr:class I SAM-dependent methyltransferase [Saccharolobus solfataricus]AAK42414.1 Methyltransferase, putative [Saccharolobus solfataricus P2]AKA72516.1 class I SAM-dependent methyltransferase [Saccharolobus solfataricus]AKA75215.1 class I SAM-dependent methyltransferase [Saccharolobus solfataricus]AKA77908.1 class I SAM-dependent methyltransferase [Saccharolobus solfataricus]AZF67026.1 class I SAM-dependent methyltransferase [Saccharolobus solfataricus]